MEKVRMPIKLIAVDMDGTFLSDEKTYDRERFKRQYKQLKELGIHFVIASGNQLYRLHAYFDDYDYGLSYVAENGAFVTAEGAELNVSHISREESQCVFELLNDCRNLCAIVCGRNSAYILDSTSEEDLQLVHKYYGRIKIITSYDEIDDDVLKVAMYIREGSPDDFNGMLAERLNGILKPVTSGHQFLDLIIPGIHKAHGLKIIQDHLGIEDHKVVAFGDNNNDAEMLEHAGFGFAMSNGAQGAKEAASFMAGHNNDSSVLDILDVIIEGIKQKQDFEEVFAPYKKE